MSDFRRKLMMSGNSPNKLILFENGVFNPVLGELKTSGQWDAASEYELNISQEGIYIQFTKYISRIGAKSFYLSNPIDVKNYSQFIIEFDNSNLNSSSGGFVNLVPEIIYSNAATEYSIVFPPDNRTTVYIDNNKTNPIFRMIHDVSKLRPQYLSFGLQIWGGKPISILIKKIYLQKGDV